ncbi:hypothetical protein DJ021_14960 [Phenylobacterium hankyongense]|uniref:Uncharacterized protein n=1 Tax=Phenylobacterium hankyongense TaxID=1813876 RepID=A0A328B566_9CAUL|nr:hypothetical protein [Phenylobacterium hankyongense]RAK61014.1 hypothetical protein DJ021_14960 [Phenylobacterium hankyongense]
MDDVARLLLLLALAGVTLTLLGGAAIWYSDEARRIRRGLRKVLRAEPHALLVARGRGRGVGFNFTSNILAVTWDAGAWCLLYRIEELVGAELVVDGQVVGRSYRGEPRRPLDMLTGADKLVRLRLVFDDPYRPDFDLDLWLPQDEARRKALSAPEAVQEANRWLARTEALFRRPVPRREAVAVAARPAPEPAPEPVAPPVPQRRPEPEPRLDALPFGDDEDQHQDEDQFEDHKAET